MKLIRDTKRGTETIMRNKTETEIRSWLNDVIESNGYTVSEFNTQGGYIGISVVKTPYSSNPQKIFYIINE